MSTITKTFKIDGTPTDMTSAKLSSQDGTYGVKRNDTSAVVVADDTAMTKIDTGVYSHTFDDPATGLAYTYSLEVTYGGETYWVVDTFTGPAGGDSATGRICTRADIKERLGETANETEHNDVIDRIVLGLESIFDRYCRRKLIQTGDDVTEYYTGLGRHLQLMYYPVISITNIKESYSYNFDSATAITADTSYRLVGAGKNGILYRIGASWPDQEDAIQVVYRGGYCSAADTPGDGETALPADLREAAIEQGSFIFKRRDDIGLSSVGFDGGSINKFSAIKLLPMVEAVLKGHIKPSL